MIHFKRIILNKCERHILIYYQHHIYTAVGVRVYVMNPIAAIHCVRVVCRVLSFVDADYEKQLRTAVYCTWYIFFLLYY